MKTRLLDSNTGEEGDLSAGLRNAAAILLEVLPTIAERGQEDSRRLDELNKTVNHLTKVVQKDLPEVAQNTKAIDGCLAQLNTTVSALRSEVDDNLPVITHNIDKNNNSLLQIIKLAKEQKEATLEQSNRAFDQQNLLLQAAQRSVEQNDRLLEQQTQKSGASNTEPPPNVPAKSLLALISKESQRAFEQNISASDQRRLILEEMQGIRSSLRAAFQIIPLALFIFVALLAVYLEIRSVPSSNITPDPSANFGERASFSRENVVGAVPDRTARTTTGVVEGILARAPGWTSLLKAPRPTSSSTHL